MAICLKESSLATSEIFNGSDGKSGINNTDGENSVNSKAIHLIKTAKHLTNEDIEGAYIQVKQITDSLTRAAIKAFDEGKIVLIYNDVRELSVTQALPFITYKTGGTYTTYVFMDKYIKFNRDNVMVLSPSDLRDLLTGALIANGLKYNYTQLASNPYLQKTLMEIYTKFFTRILNREFSIAADKVTFDVVQYWVNKFFLLNIFGITNTDENIEKLASSHFKYIDELKNDEIMRKYTDTAPSNVSELLELLKTASPRMGALNLGLFVSNWINYYYVPSMLAIDNIEYLIFMILTLLAGNANIMSISASDIVKESKNIKSLRGELLKLI